MTLALVPGGVVWLVIVAGIVVWSTELLLSNRPLVRPRPVARWLLSSWLSRLALVVAWGAAGWHMFCQRP